MENDRKSGILMPVFSLPSPYGIGTIGQAAREFIDFLNRTNQSCWQILPLGATGFGNSPYQSMSSYAGNPYFIDLDKLRDDGLLTEDEIKEAACRRPEIEGEEARGALAGGDSEGKTNTIPGSAHLARAVDYAWLYETRLPLLRKAAAREIARGSEEFRAFCARKSHWLDDYTLFMALKSHFGMKPWVEWPDEEIRLHRPEACERYRAELSEDILFFSCVQYLFFKQWGELRAYAKEKNIEIIGDMPIYVAMDSADIWSEPQWFQLGEDNIPAEVSGVPPDPFNEDGQFWGNPLYNWDAMARDGYGWWIRRLGAAFDLYDVVRFDHFRGFESYYAVPYGAKNAREGRWVKGPGSHFIRTISSWFSGKRFIAEDLGYITPEVVKLLEESGFPGMKVLEFAFEGGGSEMYQPHTYPKHCVCYTGTHDNETVAGRLASYTAEELDFAKRYIGLNDEEGPVWGFIRAGISSAANLFVAQMQDYLEIGNEGRINVPGTSEGNWTWRLEEGMITEELEARIRDMTKMYGRAPLSGSGSEGNLRDAGDA